MHADSVVGCNSTDCAMLLGHCVNVPIQLQTVEDLALVSGRTMPENITVKPETYIN